MGDVEGGQEEEEGLWWGSWTGRATEVAGE